MREIVYIKFQVLYNATHWKTPSDIADNILPTSFNFIS